MFGKEKSFGWNEKLLQENSGLLNQNELLAKRFKKSIEDVLNHKGYRQGGRADFLVSCIYTVSSRLRSEPGYTGFEFGYGRYGRYRGVGISTGSSIRQYDQGKLEINIHSSETGSLIWRGTGTREVFTHSTPAAIARAVDELVAAVLNQFPPLN